jgi:hypothetical protein
MIYSATEKERVKYEFIAVREVRNYRFLRKNQPEIEQIRFLIIDKFDKFVYLTTWDISVISHHLQLLGFYDYGDIDVIAKELSIQDFNTTIPVIILQDNTASIFTIKVKEDSDEQNLEPGYLEKSVDFLVSYQRNLNNKNNSSSISLLIDRGGLMKKGEAGSQYRIWEGDDLSSLPGTLYNLNYIRDYEEMATEIFDLIVEKRDSIIIVFLTSTDAGIILYAISRNEIINRIKVQLAEERMLDQSKDSSQHILTNLNKIGKRKIEQCDSILSKIIKFINFIDELPTKSPKKCILIYGTVIFVAATLGVSIGTYKNLIVSPESSTSPSILK